MEIVIKLFGMVLSFVPSIYFASYIIKKATEVQKFDLHINRVRDKKGNKGVIVAYINKIGLWLLITSLGVYLSTYFDNSIFLEIFIVSLMIYIISYFIDNKNDI